jgi:galactose mutarotase-like enzyme
MEISLENDLLKLQFNKSGAELKSIYSIKDNVEFLWQGPSALWDRGAPILFPVIASLRNNTYYHNDLAYEMKIHGFALHEQFEVYKKTNNEICFILYSNDQLSKIYPFAFEVRVIYTLSDNKVDFKYEVRNTGSKTMYFSIGGHPTFNCPLFQDESFTDYFLEFDIPEELQSIKMNGPYLIREKKKVKTVSKYLHLNKDLFRENALIFEHLASTNLTLRSNKNNWRICVDFKGFPYLGVFANTFVDSDKFVCIEPWFGIPDYNEGDKELAKKPGILSLEKGKEFVCNYSISCYKP